MRLSASSGTTVQWWLDWAEHTSSIPILFQVPAPDHLRPLPGDDGEDSDGKAAELHVWAVCNGERLSRLHCHQPLHYILCQQLRQRDTCQLCEWLACQTFMYGYLTSTNNWSIKTYLFIFLIIYIHLANPLDHPFRWAERCANWEKGKNNFRRLQRLTWKMDMITTCTRFCWWANNYTGILGLALRGTMGALQSSPLDKGEVQQPAHAHRRKR